MYSVASHLALCPHLTHIVLPFASDLVLRNISQSPRLQLFQNVYRSTKAVGVYAFLSVVGEGVGLPSFGPWTIMSKDCETKYNIPHYHEFSMSFGIGFGVGGKGSSVRDVEHTSCGVGREE